jgi:hypothetical protein
MHAALTTIQRWLPPLLLPPSRHHLPCNAASLLSLTLPRPLRVALYVYLVFSCPGSSWLPNRQLHPVSITDHPNIDAPISALVDCQFETCCHDQYSSAAVTLSMNTVSGVMLSVTCSLSCFWKSWLFLLFLLALEYPKLLSLHPQSLNASICRSCDSVFL